MLKIDQKREFFGRSSYILKISNNCTKFSHWTAKFPALCIRGSLILSRKYGSISGSVDRRTTQFFTDQHYNLTNNKDFSDEFNRDVQQNRLVNKRKHISPENQLDIHRVLQPKGSERPQLLKHAPVGNLSMDFGCHPDDKKSIKTSLYQENIQLDKAEATEEILKILLSSGRNPQNIAAIWDKERSSTKLAPILKALFRKERFLIALRFIVAYLKTSSFRNDKEVQEHVQWTMILYLDTLEQDLETGKISQRAASNRFQVIGDVFISLLQENRVRNLLRASRMKLLLRWLDPHLSLRIYQATKNAGLEISEAIHLIFMNRFIRAGLFAEAFQVFEDLFSLPNAGLDDHNFPRTDAFRRLFHGIYRAGATLYQSDFMELLSSSRRLIDPIIYQNFIWSAVRDNETELALNLLREGESKTGVTLGLHTYSSLFNGYRRSGDYGSMRKMYEEAVELKLEPENNPFFCTAILIAEYQRNKHYEYYDLYQIYQQMFVDEPLALVQLPLPKPIIKNIATKSNLSPPMAAITIMTSSLFRNIEYSRNGSIPWRIYQSYLHQLSLPDRPTAFQQPSEHFLGVIVDALGRSSEGNLTYAVAVIQDMMKSKLLPEPSVITWNPLLRNFARYKQVDAAERLWDMMSSRGVLPDTNTYNAMIMAYVASGREAQAGVLRARMVQEGWQANSVTEYIWNITKDQQAWIDAYNTEMERYKYEIQSVDNQ